MLIHLKKNDTSPSEDLAYLENVLQSFFWRRVTVLKLIENFPRMMLLVQENPVLMSLFADAVEKREISMHTASGYICKKQREMLRFCSGVHSDSAVGVLSKIRAECYDVDLLLEIRLLLANTEMMHVLKSAKWIPGEWLMTIRENIDYTRWALSLKDPSAWNKLNNEESKELIMWEDIQLLGYRLGVARIQKELSRCRSLESLHNVYHRLIGKDSKKY